LPYNEGWRPTALPTTLAAVVALTVELNIAGGEILPDALEMTENTIGKILTGEAIESLVGGLLPLGNLPV
jgi:hypothetical protein